MNTIATRLVKKEHKLAANALKVLEKGPVPAWPQNHDLNGTLGLPTVGPPNAPYHGGADHKRRALDAHAAKRQRRSRALEVAPLILRQNDALTVFLAAQQAAAAAQREAQREEMAAAYAALTAQAETQRLARLALQAEQLAALQACIAAQRQERAALE
jgi:hypothetical protein